MLGRTYRSISGAIFAAFILAAGGIGSAEAQQPQSPATTPSPAEQLLQQNPNAGPQLSNAIEAMVLADPSTFKIIIGLTSNATDQQKTAIAVGLAQATKVEVLTNQALATDWQQQIAAITDPTFKIAAINAFGDVQLAAVGGGSLGAAGSGLGGPGIGPTTGFSSSLESLASNPVTTQAFSLTSSIGGASEISNSVSP
jgi:hypothetical protein